MSEYVPNEVLENKTIVHKYRELLTVLWPKTNAEERKNIRKAFVLATNAHNGTRRKSGEPYIYHPIAVALICCKEINLGATSVICALLHDVVEDTDYTLEDIRELFGDVVAEIIDGLTKIDDLVFDNKSQSIQAENFKKIFLSMSKDIRVILIKLADRLHNMRTLDAMPPEKQLKIASETSYFYVPFAHRLGLYTIKSELEDYAMKYTDPVDYYSIANKLKETDEERQQLIAEFVKPIQESLEENGIKATMSSRTKSVYSIYQKILNKNVKFEDIYDIFAVRFVFDSPVEQEFEICWRIYKIVCLLYPTNPSRDRNFLTHPKPNGYQSLHLTAMSKAGKWVEVQIRSKRMDEIAEKGLAAHYKYKEDGAATADSDMDNRLEDWLMKTREILKSQDSDALEFLNEVRLNLGLKEIYVFTPKGDMRTLPAGSTVLDLAYQLHTNLGDHCIGAKVNYNIVPFDRVLSNGDQVEIITSKKQIPKPEWLNVVHTARARRSIRDFLRSEQTNINAAGEELLQSYFKEFDVEYTPENVEKIETATLTKSRDEFWNNIVTHKISKNKIRKILAMKQPKELAEFQKKIEEEISDLRFPIVPKNDALLKVQCFGNFDVFTPDGTPVHFERSKSKEVFAYLVHRHGSSCTIKEIAAALFEDEPYDSKQQAYVQKIMSAMMKSLKKVGAQKTVNKSYNSLSVNVNTLDCDYYRFADLDAGAVNAYQCEYMSQYYWADFMFEDF